MSERKMLINQKIVRYHEIGHIKITQRSISVVSYLLGILTGFLFTLMFYKYLQIDELLQETTKPMLTVSNSAMTPHLSVNLTEEVKILCWILTFPQNHNTKALAVRNTWGRSCNKLVFVSSELHAELDVILVQNITEERTSLWSKTRQGLEQIAEKYGKEFDWFLKADDDTWMFMDNLRRFLYAYSSEMPIYFGCKLKNYVPQGYMSGGSGYVMSREALRLFKDEALPNPDKCGGSSKVGAEDVEIGKCLYNVGVLAGDSRDEMNRSRFLPFPADGLIRNLFGETWLDNASYYEIKKGIDCCSPSVISFHYMPFNEMYVFDFLLHYVQHPSSPRSHDSFIEIDELPRKLDFDDIQMRLNSSTVNNNEIPKNSTTSEQNEDDENISSTLTTS